MATKKIFTVSDKLAKALTRRARKDKSTEGEVLRQALAAYLGKPELAGEMKRGRPRKPKSNS